MNAPLHQLAAAMSGEIDMRLGDCGYIQQGGWDVAWAQVVGCHHPNLTEDSVAWRVARHGDSEPAALCLAVADGVGRGARGEVASTALVQHCVDVPDRLLGDAIGLADWMRTAEGQVQMKLREVSFSPGAATVAAAWLLPDGTGHLLRVGDARLYLDDGASVHPLTVDQSYAQVRETPPPGAGAGDPARMVGTGSMGEPEVLPLALGAGNILLLCSDGLVRGLDSSRIASTLRENCLGEAALALVRAARHAGSDDDITVLLAQPTPSPVERRLADRHARARAGGRLDHGR